MGTVVTYIFFMFLLLDDQKTLADEVRRGTSLRRAAEMHNINRMSLLRYIRKHDEVGANHDVNSISM